jgi:phage terminase large subunit-like protein
MSARPQPATATRSTISSPSAPAFRTEADYTTDYARAVVAGTIVAGRLVRLACERHLRDLEDGAARGLVWSPAHANKAIRFFGFLKHSKGEFGGQTLQLAPWQRFIFGSVHGWRIADGPKRGLRRFKTVLSVLGKKNGKSTMCGGAGLHGLLADDEPGAEIYSVATKKDQARQVFDAAREMVRRSPLLLNRLDPLKTAIVDPASASTFKPLSADTGGADGVNPHVVIVDELHRHKTPDMLNLMAESMGARRQPLLWIITTAGDDKPGTPYANEEDYAIKVLEGTLVDDSYFAYLATLDPGDDWTDERNWIKANPNLGVSPTLEDLREQAAKAKGKPDAQASFKRLRLNIRTAAQDRAVEMSRWDALAPKADAPPADDELRGRPCIAAFDGSSKVDTSALVRLFAPRGKGEKWIVRARFWIPGENIEERGHRDRAPYAAWVKAGWIEATPGNIVDHDQIERELEAMHRLTPFEALAFDPWGVVAMMARLQGKGVPTVEFGQTIRMYAAASNEFEARLEAGDLDHGGNPVLRWQASNLHWIKDGKDNKMPHKGRSTGRIDGMSALVMAHGRAVAPSENRESVYATRGLVVIEA